jgi:hypothetical protein
LLKGEALPEVSTARTVSVFRPVATQ